MRGFGKLLRNVLITGVLGSALIVGAAQFVQVSANTPAMAAMDAAIDKVSALKNFANLLGDKLIFRQRQDVSLQVEPRPNPAAQQSTLSPSVSQPTYTLPMPSMDGPNWGLVKAHEARSFTDKGKPRARIAAGTVLLVFEKKKTSLGACLRCATTSSPTLRFLVFMDDVMQFGGNPEDTPLPIRNMLVEKATALADIKKLESDAEKAHRKNNPHYGKYQATKADYVLYWRKVKSLQASRDAVSGNGHVGAEDELRALKGEDVRIGEAYKSEKTKFDAWVKQNPTPSISNSPRYQLLRTRLDEIDARLAASS
ncbi:MAG: hypothetical protein ACI9OU_000876 [Candidatus Promineifilaceae bacterium]|jgi:hypothetical protein